MCYMEQGSESGYVRVKANGQEGWTSAIGNISKMGLPSHKNNLLRVKCVTNSELDWHKGGSHEDNWAVCSSIDSDAAPHEENGTHITRGSAVLNES